MAIRDFITAGGAVTAVAAAGALLPGLMSRADAPPAPLPEACAAHQGIWASAGDQGAELTVLIASQEIAEIEFTSYADPVDARVDWEASWGSVSKRVIDECDATTKPGILRIKADGNWQYEIDLAHGRLALGAPESWEAAKRPQWKR
ncbi:hypothetical protein sos41_17550 [Alphaproteobacteria bacterium SO-S41]|nr:hypothetical protein sos41_17550 [Alphaproteobacteria bacterium SO-S41]